METSTPNSNFDDPVVATQAKNFTKAIFQHESGMNYNATGDAGTSHGAGQWQPATWKLQAKDVLGDENAPMTPENQSVVAQGTFRHWFTPIEKGGLGLNAAQGAAKWNSGSPDGWENKVGTATINGQPVKYNVPQYVKSITDLYQQYKGQNSQSSQGFNPTPYSKPTNGTSVPDNSVANLPDNPPSTDTSLGTELLNRTNDAGGAISDTMSGKINPVSGLLQTVGAGAGALGDVVNKGLELIPGVKAIEGVIGTGIGALAKTTPGQAIVKSLQDFNTKHPELSKDIGASFNIVTALPILDGLGALKGVALDGISQALKGVAENVVEKDLTATTARTVGGRIALTSGGASDIKTLIAERALPDIIDNKYATKEAFDNLSAKISNIEDTKLQPLLAKTNTANIADKIPIEDLRQEALASVKEEFKSGGQVGKATDEVNRIMDDYKNSYGDYVSLQDVNDMKRGIRQTVNFNSPKLESDVSYHLGQTFMKNIETSADKLGLGDVKAINQEMQKLIKAQNALKFIEGKSVKTGLVGGLIKDTATVGGEMLGNSTGIPLAGAYIGREGGGYVGKKLSGITKGILDRTAPNAVKLTKEQLAKKMGGLFGGAVSQKINQK